MSQPKSQHNLLVILGPTASGKTRLGVDVARRLHGLVHYAQQGGREGVHIHLVAGHGGEAGQGLPAETVQGLEHGTALHEDRCPRRPAGHDRVGRVGLDLEDRTPGEELSPETLWTTL